MRHLLQSHRWSRVDDCAHSFKKLTLKFWTMPCQDSFKFGAGDPVLRKTVCFVRVMIHGVAQTCEFPLVPGKLMLLMG